MEELDTTAHWLALMPTSLTMLPSLNILILLAVVELDVMIETAVAARTFLGLKVEAAAITTMVFS